MKNTTKTQGWIKIYHTKATAILGLGINISKFSFPFSGYGVEFTTL